ncbi:hypothetical protein NMY22_g19160 [Coprinellus aureogranulatus]|nr:hypothetical protein NMY22_g19160 [Coprinellus aureogranulatus]
MEEASAEKERLERKVARLRTRVLRLSKEMKERDAQLRNALAEKASVTARVETVERELEGALRDKMKYWRALTDSRREVELLEQAMQQGEDFIHERRRRRINGVRPGDSSKVQEERAAYHNATCSALMINEAPIEASNLSGIGVLGRTGLVLGRTFIGFLRYSTDAELAVLPDTYETPDEDAVPDLIKSRVDSPYDINEMFSKDGGCRRVRRRRRESIRKCHARLRLRINVEGSHFAHDTKPPSRPLCQSLSSPSPTAAIGPHILPRDQGPPADVPPPSPSANPPPPGSFAVGPPSPLKKALPEGPSSEGPLPGPSSGGHLPDPSVDIVMDEAPAVETQAYDFPNVPQHPKYRTESIFTLGPPPETLRNTLRYHGEIFDLAMQRLYGDPSTSATLPQRASSGPGQPTPSKLIVYDENSTIAAPLVQLQKYLYLAFSARGIAACFHNQPDEDLALAVLIGVFIDPPNFGNKGNSLAIKMAVQQVVTRIEAMRIPAYKPSNKGEVDEAETYRSLLMENTLLQLWCAVFCMLGPLVTRRMREFVGDCCTKVQKSPLRKLLGLDDGDDEGYQVCAAWASALTDTRLFNDFQKHGAPGASQTPTVVADIIRELNEAYVSDQLDRNSVSISCNYGHCDAYSSKYVKDIAKARWTTLLNYTGNSTFLETTIKNFESKTNCDEMVLILSIILHDALLFGFGSVKAKKRVYDAWMLFLDGDLVNLSLWLRRWARDRAVSFKQNHPNEFSMWCELCISWMKEVLNTFKLGKSGTVKLQSFVDSISSQPNSAVFDPRDTLPSIRDVKGKQPFSDGSDLVDALFLLRENIYDDEDALKKTLLALHHEYGDPADMLSINMGPRNIVPSTTNNKRSGVALPKKRMRRQDENAPLAPLLFPPSRRRNLRASAPSPVRRSIMSIAQGLWRDSEARHLAHCQRHPSLLHYRARLRQQESTQVLPDERTFHPCARRVILCS